MLSADYPVVLDACVLVPPSLCDLLLRLAETPRLYLPRWSEKTLDEVHRNQMRRIGFSPERADSWRAAVTDTFPEATIRGYEGLIESCANHPEDRHVLAAARYESVHTILTANLKHFRPEALEPWGVAATHPSDYLQTLYEHRPELVVGRLDDIARSRSETRAATLARLKKLVPGFALQVADGMGVAL